MLQLGVEDLGLYSSSNAIIGEEKSEVRVVVERSTRYARGVVQFSVREYSLVQSEVFSHKGAA